jgi:hypothetical protein
VTVVSSSTVSQTTNTSNLTIVSPLDVVDNSTVHHCQTVQEVRHGGRYETQSFYSVTERASRSALRAPGAFRVQLDYHHQDRPQGRPRRVRQLDGGAWTAWQQRASRGNPAYRLCRPNNLCSPHVSSLPLAVAPRAPLGKGPDQAVQPAVASPGVHPVCDLSELRRVARSVSPCFAAS